MDNDTHNIDTITEYMREHGLSKEDVLLMLQHHVNDLQFNKDLSNHYESDEWDAWVEGAPV